MWHGLSLIAMSAYNSASYTRESRGSFLNPMYSKGQQNIGLGNVSKEVIVSVIMPIYNEEKYIIDCVESLLTQDYPRSQMEWIFVDGGSRDKTKDFLVEYQEKYTDLIIVLDNPYKTVPYAMNIGIAQSKGKYVILLGAHAMYDNDYISKCVYYLDTTDADNVGGLAITKSRGEIGQAIALMLSSKFGVGDSQFRTNGKSGYVDTVPFGAFRREVFSKYGGFDERLTRNQDYELNFRIRKNGGKLYLSRDIRFAYYCRDSINGIVKNAFANGMWNVITMKLCPGSMGIRHFVPLAFVMSILLLVIGCFFIPIVMWLLVLELALYFSLDVIFSIKQARKIKEFIYLMILFPIFHISYGLGSIKGIFSLFSKKFNTNYSVPKI